ncbi:MULTISPECIES: iron-dicitrate ABC transporter permease FecC [Pseudomonas]|jgi:iron complex transport system permease protein|uniref:Iron complex transport system permease protein n=3 Tax=Pseudomonas syringae TaxID=317 RepID=A0AB37ZL96_PSESX|nr:MULTISPECIES: iron-dicitrate ABC transporter permease FecC [Pseudomonas]KPY23164.1 Iron-dicitrate transporter permease subunit [Pseudomonas syringae pv. papulans]KWS40560.1 iron ABC transporter [Pseudomonas syringae pv. papulans]MBC9743452.1 iron-dicitrate ABC transporter permease FecC [Pseudomonas syringae pv. syringae]MBC9750520.1 iron-dicitrate ABC transporter permease FecC [Pseudomonas syringae pv. syringae]MBI6668162.1 iron-dicitrate ABC transporter permease FecC [Pseudomonas syringae]
MRRWLMAGVITATCLGLFWVSLFALSSFSIRQVDAWNGLITQGREGGNIAYIVAQLRVPRALCAALVGACLGVAGALMQGITRNRLASPSLFGVTAGAALGLALFSTGLVALPFPGGALLMTCLGGALAWITVFSLGGAWSPATAQGRLVLAGVAVAALCAALTRLTVILVEAQAQSVLNWLAGSLANVGAAQLQLLWPCTLIGVVLAIACAPRLNLINLGEDAARSLGVRIGALRLLVFVVSLLLVGASVCAVGPIAFVGLIAPNIARQWLGNDYRWLIPISAGLGAAIVLASDLISRAVAFPVETPAGVVTALIGAPFFLFLARRAL